MRLGLHILHWVILSAVVVVTTLGMTLFFTLQGSLPQREGIAIVSNLSQKIDIRRDATGIPSIESTDRDSVLFGLGFVHAQEQFLSMDLLRRSSVGRLYELLGDRAMPADFHRRHFTFENQVQQLWAAASAQERALLTAYSHGVNAGLNQLTQPPAFYSLRNRKVQPWEPQDALRVWLSLMLLVHEPQLIAALEGTRASLGQQPGLGFHQLTWADNGLGYQLQIHTPDVLPLTQPWYQARWRIIGQTDWTQGLTLPGLPMMLMGRNEDLAWSMQLLAQAPFQWLRLQVSDEQFWHPERGWTEFTYQPIDVPGTRQADFIRQTPWGPVLGQDTQQNWLVLAWPDVAKLNLSVLTLDQHQQAPDVLAQVRALPGTELIALDRNGAWSVQYTLSAADGILDINEQSSTPQVMTAQRAVWQGQPLREPLTLGSTTSDRVSAPAQSSDWPQLLFGVPARPAIWQPAFLYPELQTSQPEGDQLSLNVWLAATEVDTIAGHRRQSWHLLQPYEPIPTAPQPLAPGSTRYQLTLLPGR